MRWVGNAAHMGGMRYEDNIFIRNQEKIPRRRPRCRWGDNIRMDLTEIEWEGMDWNHLVQNRDQWQALVNVIMKFRVQ
jgi:hypothetical protein